MKKGQIVTVFVERVDFPNKGLCRVIDSEENSPAEYVRVKNSIPGQKLKVLINKLKHKKAEGRILEILEPSPYEVASLCPHFGICGGCTYLNMKYEKQLELKEKMVREVLAEATEGVSDWFEGIRKSPVSLEYRNKMEFSFGDEYKDGPLALGMHKRGSFYDVVTTDGCRLVHEDFRLILGETLDYFKNRGAHYLHKMTHQGYLRHLLVRRGVCSEEILVALVTTTQKSQAGDSNVEEWTEIIKNLQKSGKLTGSIAGILHIENDSLADVVVSDKTNILYGKDYFYEKLLKLQFKISPFSFFQTNTLGAEVLYETAREFALEAIKDQGREKVPVIYDLYSGTGTIAQLMAPVAEKVIGVEIVEEAVCAARENAKLNALDNCSFIAGDVLKVLDTLTKERPDLIILDPPRDGCHPKALPKIVDYGAPNIVYISCKVTSLARDLQLLKAGGYEIKRAVAIDQFPGTYHVESVVLFKRVEDEA